MNLDARDARKKKKGKDGNDPGPDPDPEDELQRLLDLINDHRRANGRAALTRRNPLDTAAQSHSEDMAARNYFAHVSPEGNGPDQRIAATGYAFDWWGENIHRGGASAQEAFTWWKGSPGHNANMLSPNFEEIGLGRAFDDDSGHWLWTTVFASPA